MYLVTNKNLSFAIPELFPSFIVEGLLQRAKKDKKVFVKPSGNKFEIQTPTLWLVVERAEFTRP